MHGCKLIDSVAGSELPLCARAPSCLTNRSDRFNFSCRGRGGCGLDAACCGAQPRQSLRHNSV
eukprot:6187884-Pleurochrysis_carterae.AAC.5